MLSGPSPIVLVRDSILIFLKSESFAQSLKRTSETSGYRSMMVTMDLDRHEVLIYGHAVDLAPKGFQILNHFLQLVIPRSLLRGQSFLVPSGVWRTRGMMQSERERTVRGKSTTTLSFP